MLTDASKKLFQILSSLQEAYLSPKRNAVAFVCDTREGFVKFYPDSLAEMTVTDCLKDETIYWIHLDLTQRDVWRESLNAFFQILFNGKQNEILPDMKGRPHLKCMVACTSGITSDLFASLLQEECQLADIPAVFESGPASLLLDLDKDEADFILLAPQAASYYTDLIEKFTEPKVMLLSPLHFGSLNVKAVLAKLYLRHQA